MSASCHIAGLSQSYILEIRRLQKCAELYTLGIQRRSGVRLHFIHGVRPVNFKKAFIVRDGVVAHFKVQTGGWIFCVLTKGNGTQPFSVLAYINEYRYLCIEFEVTFSIWDSSVVKDSGILETNEAGDVPKRGCSKLEQEQKERGERIDKKGQREQERIPKVLGRKCDRFD